MRYTWTPDPDGGGGATSHAALTNVLAGQHHPQAHSGDHAAGGIDELAAFALSSGAVGTGLLMQTDGAGGWTMIPTPAGGADGNTAFHTFSLPGDIEAATGTLRIPITIDQTIINVRAMLDDAPVGADAVYDLLISGTSAYPTTTKPTVAIGATDSGNTTPDTIALTEGQHLTVAQLNTPTDGANGVLIVEVEI